MKEKLEQEIKHLKQKINQKEKISRRLSLAAVWLVILTILGMVVLGSFAEELLKSLSITEVIVWALVFVVLVFTAVFKKESIDKLKKKLRGVEKRLNLRNFLDKLETMTESEIKKMLVEKILKEAE